MNISVVIPLLNEEESLPELEAWIRRVVEPLGYTYEIIMVDDGSKDSSWKVIEGLAQNNPNVRGIKFRRNYGKSAALNTGFQAAQGEVVITMDADLQDSPDEIPGLYKMIIEDGYDLVSGWKKTRHDPFSKTFPSKFFNAATRYVSGIPLHDFNCGLKAYKNDVVKCIEVYGEMHRYIPLIAKGAGFGNIGEKVVAHQARKYGSTKFGGIKRGLIGLLDLMSITFVGRFSKRPMHFFGTMGFFASMAGVILLGYLSIQKLVYQAYFITDRPLFYLGILLLIVGTQLFVTGFLAELVSRNSPDRNNYLIEKRINE
ncbi:MAG: glycosyltransferase family 2 protein [Saprospiraceae bacterium]|nr:glycosyltransferase family 2 protein [Saprospiraceae bacterium]